MHVAAGTDFLTAVAALPCDSDVENELPRDSAKSSINEVVWAVLLFIAIVVVTMWML